MNYPAARVDDQVDDYHGTRVPDPYRWLEEVDSAETRAWIEAQNALTFGWLEKIPTRERIRERLTRLWDYPKVSPPWWRGNRYFSFRNEGLQNQPVLFVQEGPDGEARVLLDANGLSEDGTVSLGGLGMSEDGRRVAWARSESGSDWMEWRVRDVDSGEDLPDVLRWSKFSAAAWTHDGTGFFYSAYDEPEEGQEYKDQNYFQKLYFHRLGTTQSEDCLVYERPDEKEWGFLGSVSEDGRYLVIQVWKGTDPKNRIYYLDLADPAAGVVALLDEGDARYEFVGNDGGRFYFLTDNDAPRGRIVAVDTARPAPEHWTTLLPEGEDVLQVVQMIHDRFVVLAMHHAHNRLSVHGLDGAFEKEIELPTMGSVLQITGRRADSRAYLSFMSFLYPTTVFRYDFETGERTVYRDPAIDFDPGGYETRQVFFESADGTRVPMFLVHRKGLKLDGENPVYLYGYGGFNVSLTPGFSVSNLIWMEMGGVYAQPNLRGGGEYGEEWHEAGTLHRKQNVFDDCIAAAEWLIENGYTRPERLAISGGSNGGLLVGAVLNQRPDLFGAALPSVGVMDMLRFHEFTIGWAWCSDYGSSEDPEQFQTLLAYSPYHNIEEGGRYPPVFVTTADHDDRVFPAHSFKYAARLQACQSGEAPILIRIQTKAGHGMGKPTSMMIEEEVDRWAFLSRVLNVPHGKGSQPAADC